MQSLARIFDLIAGLLSVEDISILLEKTSESVRDLFGFDRVSISILDPVRGIFTDHAMAGYSTSEEKTVEDSPSAFEIAEILEDFREDCKISRIAYYVPFEKQTSSVENFVGVKDTDAAKKPRRSSNAWHELDLLYFSLTNRKGQMIGFLQVDYPVNGLIPSKEVIEEIELFATVAAVGIENSETYKQSLLLLEENEVKTERLSRILDLTRSVLRVDDLDVVLKKVSDAIASTFGYRKTGVSLFTEGQERVHVFALTGYSKDEEQKVRESVMLKSVILPYFRDEFRITKNGYFIPAESLHDQSVFVFHENPEMAMAKRSSPNSWHELDLVFFALLDREGRALGYIQLGYPLGGKIPTKDTMEDMEAFASIATIAIENSALFRESNEAQKQVKMYLDLLTHDVGNFINPINAYLELVVQTTSLNEKQLKYLFSALEATRSTIHLLRNVKRSAQMLERAEAEIVPMNLTKSLHQTSSDAKAAFISKKVVIRLNLPDRDIWVMADSLLDEVFYNILTNAIKYDEHEEIVIDVQVEIVETEGRRCARVKVTDRGLGIPDDLKDRVFSRGFRDLLKVEHPVLVKGRGAGMGLSLVKALVDRYGGNIWAENRVYDDYTRGTVFVIILPKP
jgi:signal transduction histidine kinase/uncharacterized protein YigA (DUF484 family)